MMICTTCTWAIPKPKDCTTSSLLHHLKKKHPDLYSCIKDRDDRTKHERATAAERALALAQGLKLWKSEPEAGPEAPQAKRPCLGGAISSSSSTSFVEPLNHLDAKMDSIERAITQLLCTTALPSSFLESPGFRNLLSVVAPKFQLKSRAHFGQHSLARLYDEYATRIRAILSSASFVSFATDLRALPQSQESLLTFTVHFIDETFVPRFAYVSANLIDGVPSTEEVANLLSRAQATFGVSHEKIHVLAEHWPVDNRSEFSNVNTVQDFSQKLQKAVVEGLRVLLPNNESLIEKVKEIAQRIDLPESERIFRDCNRICGLSTEGFGMCWNCLYTLLCRIVEQKNSLSFVLIESLPNMAKITDTDWNEIEAMIRLLKPIDLAVGLVKRRYFTPISVVIPLYKVIVRQLNGGSFGSEAVRETIRRHLDASMSGCEEMDELFLATFADPRFRTAYFSADKRQEVLEKLEEMALLPVATTTPSPEPTFEDSANPFVAFRRLEPSSKHSSTNESKIEASTRALAELDDYLLHDPSFATDPYEFWQNEVNSAKYPLIKKLATKYLSPPGISLECQAVFSQLELFNGDLRRNWERDELERLLFLHHNILIFGF
ncbi:hypothetical protein Q1695_011289 [Nippostrongylus brasiliensis]|nr:hypothetical protein Q1695_011289 [Nippostrongylus brasiliensis]